MLAKHRDGYTAAPRYFYWEAFFIKASVPDSNWCTSAAVACVLQPRQREKHLPVCPVRYCVAANESTSDSM